MFDFAWTEIALIGVVALVLIGPKDMPVAIKAVSSMVKKARRMAAEFQTHVDDMVKDADLHEMRDQIREIRSLDIRGSIARAVDSDGSIRRTLTEDPLKTPPPPPAVVTQATDAETAAVIAERSQHTIAAPEAEPPPAMIPPADVVKDARMEAPAFIPPEAAHPEAAHPAHGPHA